MFFQNPLVWWLAPLALIPLLIYFRQFLKQHTQELPSLFFIKNLIARKRKNLSKYFLAEIILEMLIILLAIFIWSQPTFKATPQSGDKLILLIDDSPSMRYFYLGLDGTSDTPTTPSALVPSIEDILTQNLYSQIEAKRISTLAKGETQPITSIDDLKTFLKNISETTVPAEWQAQNLKQTLTHLTPTDTTNAVTYLIYSDFKANHFSQPINKTPPITESAEHNNAPPPSIYALKETSSPYIGELELATRHFFEQEKTTLTHRLYNIPLKTTSANATSQPTSEDLFLEVTLDDNQVFLSKINSPLSPPTTNSPPAKSDNKKNNANQTTPPTIPTTNILSGRVTQQVPLILKSDLVLDKAGVHIISVALKKNTTTIQRESEVVFVYPKLTIKPIGADKRVTGFLEALFLYDKRADAISLAPDGEILLITDPEKALAELSLTELQRRKAIVLLSPTRDLRAMETVLRQLSGTALYLSSLEKMSAQSQFYWNERPQNTPAFDPSFSIHNNYLKLNPQSTKKIRTLFSVDSHPILFALPKKAFFMHLNEASLLSAPHPLHLVWFYEAIFALSGGKRVIPIYNEAEFTLSSLSARLTNLSKQLFNNLAEPKSVTSPSQSTDEENSSISTSYLYKQNLPRVWEDANNVYIVKKPAAEYNAPSIIEVETNEATLPYLGKATMLNAPVENNPTQQQTLTFSFIEPIDLALYFIAVCLSVLAILLFQRMRLARQT
ncbi:hypothetical protein COTS27_00315 [Spirochaetota bacterium]|nr:hypothetical protein COTS27_00315 [Spirochaetota bacterium]